MPRLGINALVYISRSDQVHQTGQLKESTIGLDKHGLKPSAKVFWNLGAAELIEHAIRNGDGKLSEDDGAIVCLTGHSHHCRSPNATNSSSATPRTPRQTVNWGKVNAGMTPENFDKLHTPEVLAVFVRAGNIYVRDMHAGADDTYRLKARILNEKAWHNLFAANMFIQPPESALKTFDPDFTVLHAPYMKADPKVDGTNSEVCFIVLNFAKEGRDHRRHDLRR